MSLFGSWIGEEMSTSSRSLIYQSLVHFLQALPNSTLGTRLSAARSLGKCDTWGFELEAFLPFLDDAVKGLVKLMEECDMIESRMRLMQTLGTLIGAVGQQVCTSYCTSTKTDGEQILPYAGQLFSILPSLWASAEGQTLFKVSILAIVEKLTEVRGRCICPVWSISTTNRTGHRRAIAINTPSNRRACRILCQSGFSKPFRSQ